MIVKHIHSLEPGAIVELFDLDLTPIDPAAGIARFHAGTNELSQPVVWQQYSYEPRPVQASGFGITTTGSAPRPKLQVSNIPTTGSVGLMTLLNRDYRDLVGAIVTRHRTLVKYLDAVNFPGAVNPDADPTVEFPLDIYYVERRLTENRLYAEYELSSIYDLEGVYLPGRQVIRDTCSYSYRSWDATADDFLYQDARGLPVACPYTGVAYFDRMGNPVAEASQDQCGRRLSDCRKRFSTGTRTLDQVAVPIVSESLPFGGFPGAGRYNR
ncbi:MAG: phage minor tail protein L [Geobacteraceae bacterium GWC2_58_44]|nr:MAG: phage minor tail protein L [Geobacteraceae bacterium GWC2_58_44]HBG06330.1 phage minor tail protein L [Geobacter sp.]